PSWELRWNTTWTGDASPWPNRGHAFDLATPLWVLGTGLRVDALEPPDAAPAPFDGPYHWIRWGLGLRAGQEVAFGTTLGWGLSQIPSLDGYFSITSGLTVRAFPWLSLAVVARDWNEPIAADKTRIERRYDFGFAARPFSSDAIELGFEAAYYEKSK